MDVFQGGLNQGNLAVTSVILLGLIIVSTKANILDKAGYAQNRSKQESLPIFIGKHSKTTIAAL